MASIRKREQTLKNGRQSVLFEATVNRVGTRRQSKSFPTKTAAERWARQIESQIDQGAWVDTSSAQQMSVADALHIYVREVVPHLKSAPSELNRPGNLGGSIT